MNNKTKTLAIILNHNLPEYTLWLYRALREYEGDDYDLLVMDNGSRQEFVPAFTHVRFEKNLYWGGALNEAFSMVLRDDRYDSLLFMNNDIEVTPEIFVKALRHEMFTGDYTILSPCIAGRERPWKQMQNWGTKGTRIVKWIDNEAPLFHRRIIEKIKQFDDALFYGWGQELICFDVCEQHGWKTGVCDHISMLHYAKQTILQNRLFSSYDIEVPLGSEKIINWDEYLNNARASYWGYFEKNPLKHATFEEMVEYGEKYSCFPDW